MRALEDEDPDSTLFDEAQRRRNFREFVQNPELGSLLIIAVGRETVGYAILTLGYSFEYRGRDAFVDELYVAPAQRRCGLGTAALAELEKIAREHNVQALHLEVTAENSAAIETYRRAGFKDHERRLMSKRL